MLVPHCIAYLDKQKAAGNPQQHWDSSSEALGAWCATPAAQAALQQVGAVRNTPSGVHQPTCTTNRHVLACSLDSCVAGKTQEPPSVTLLCQHGASIRLTGPALLRWVYRCRHATRCISLSLMSQPPPLTSLWRPKRRAVMVTPGQTPGG